MGLNVLVTGGAGYFGSHACKALASAGHYPVTYDSLVYGHPWAVRWGPLVEGDLADSDLLRRTLKEHRIDAVMHFATFAYLGESMQDPGKYFRNNVGNTINLLDAMVAGGVGTIVFSSTCATYGMPEAGTIAEDDPQRPVNPYVESKLFIERALKRYGAAHGIRWAALRYFNAAGADPDGEIGEDHEPETHLIPLVIQTALGQRAEVQVFGTDYPTADGSAVRGYIHVTDLGTDHGHSVKEVIAMVERLSGLKVKARESDRRPGDPPALVAESGLAAQLLDWYPQYSELETIVATALQWHQSQRGELERALSA